MCTHNATKLGRKTTVRFTVLLVLVICLLAGCKASDLSFAAAGTSSQTVPTSTDLQQPTSPTWEQVPSADLFLLHQYNGSLEMCWAKGRQADGSDTSFWLQDEDGARYYVDALDYISFYGATYWIRVELTEAGRHYCDISWTLSLQSLTKIEYDGDCIPPFTTAECVIPYYLECDRITLGGWVVYGKLAEPAVAELMLEGEFGPYTEKIWLAPSLPNTYVDPSAFRVDVLKQKLELTQIDENLYSTEWNGQTCYFDNFLPSAVRDANCVMILTPAQWLKDLEKEQSISVGFHFMGYDTSSIYLPKISGYYPLYADPEMTQCVALYIFVGVENKDSVGLTLQWTEENGVQACSKIIYYDHEKIN